MPPHRKKPFAEQIVVCGKDFCSRKLVSTEFPSDLNALFRSLSCDYGVLSKLCAWHENVFLSAFVLSSNLYILSVPKV